MASYCIARGRSPPNGLTYPKTSETYPNDHLLSGVVRQFQSSVSAVSLGRLAPQLRVFTALAKKCSLGKPHPLLCLSPSSFWAIFEDGTPFFAFPSSICPVFEDGTTPSAPCAPDHFPSAVMPGPDRFPPAVMPGPDRASCRRLRRSSLQCTHLKIRLLQKVIPLLLRGIILYKSLTINCVRCGRGLNCVR